MTTERKSIRLSGYDYSSDNLYFVTSCVHDRICCFGEIAVVGTGRDLILSSDDLLITKTNLSLQRSKRQMVLNEYGKIAEKQWYWLADQYPYILLHAFIVMPNHIHGIIEINRKRMVAGTGRDPSLHVDNTLQQIKIKSLSGLMGAYKTTVSRQIHLSGFAEFTWQRSFYEHIIRDDKSFESISEYITSNPFNWEHDDLYII